jgi:colanic acid biosynthesis glycosyl transferase WcaI
VGRPILFFGPKPSHIADLLDQHFFGWDVMHGDVDRAERAIRAAMNLSPDELRAVGRTGQQLLHERLGQTFLCGQFCAALEERLKLGSPAVQSPATAKETDECAPALS